jgi:predicted nucleic acid-binding protein
VTLVDTSAWVEYLRSTGSPVDLEVGRLLVSHEATIHTTDTVVMEVLAGGRDESHTTQLRRLLGRCEFVPTKGLGDFELAASMYRQCRRAGSTVRALTDCLIGAVALRTDIPVLQADRDFDALARHTGLRLAPVAANEQTS